MKAIGYTRVSTEEQAAEGLSIDAQAERIRAYCKASDLKLVELLSDEGISAAKPLASRPAGSKSVASVGAGVGSQVWSS